MRSWDLRSLEAPTPVVVHSEHDARAIVLELGPGEQLGDHQVRERAWVTLVEGEAIFTCGDETVTAAPGTLLVFDPGERHAVATEHGARLLLVLAPWPADGHYVEGEIRDDR